VARLNKIAISLCALLFTSISFTPLAHASGHTHASATPKAHAAKGTQSVRKKPPVRKVKPPPKPPARKPQRPPAPDTTRTTAASQTALHRQAAGTKKCVLRKGYKKQCAKTVAPAPSRPRHEQRQSKCVVRKGYKNAVNNEEEPPLTIADAHKVRVQKAQSTAMSS
jgi:murein DD-endopeptidase